MTEFPSILRTARQNECEEAYAVCVAENPSLADWGAFGLAACEVAAN